MIKKIWVCLIPCFTIMLASAASGQIEAWKNLGLYGGAGRQIAVDPASANHIFLAAGDSWGTYSYVTTNAGLAWNRLAINGGTVAYDPNNNTTVYLGKYRSADNGQTWNSNDTLVALSAEVQAVKPGDSQTIFAKNRSDTAAQLFRTIDGGETWSNVTPAGITQARWANTGRPLAFDPIDSSVVYLVLERNPNEVADDFGIYKSTNGGLTWTRKDTNQAASIIVHPQDRGRLLAVGGAFESPVRRSADTGETWQVTGPMSDILVYHPETPDTVYTIGNGCALSTNFGLTWSDWFLQGQIGFDCDAVIPAAASSNIFICQFDYGFFRVNADLSGQEERNQGIMELTTAVALVRNQSRHIVVGAERGVSASFDGAVTWHHFVGTAPGGDGPLLNQVADLCFGYDTTQTVWAVGEGANISEDSGLNWRRMLTNDFGPQVTSYAAVVFTAVGAVPDTPQNIFFGAYDEQGPADRSLSGLYVSTNNGGNLVQIPLFTGYVNRVVVESDASYTSRVPVAAASARLMYAAVGYLQDAGVRGLYWSEDSGNTWSLRGFSGKKVSALAVDALDGQIVYAGIIDANAVSPDQVHQIQLSIDAGLNWTNITFPEFGTNSVRIVSLATAPTNSGVVYVAGMNDQLNVGFIAGSEDYGQTWNILAGPIERLHVVAGGSLYGAMNGGFYTYTNVEETAVSMNCLAADFDGDAKADPAVYNTNGTWKIKLSNANYTMIPLTGFLGGSGYTALAADFDGDAKADPAIYNAALELWAVKLSSLNYLAPTIIQNFGGTGWEAIAEDFDGDAKADPALYNTNGTWKIMLSGANYVTITKPDFMGSSGWTAIAADFDGDGKVDPTIYKASTGAWIVMLSKAGYILAVLETGFLGSTGYTGIGADFDGDSLADPTVAQTSTGNWEIRLSNAGYIKIPLAGFLGE